MKAVPLENLKMFQSYTNKWLLALLIIVLQSSPVFAQDESDTVRYTGPSICECVKLAKEDRQLLSQCDQKYDYNAMSSFQRSAFEEKIKACTNPAVCDCEERSKIDAELKKVCDTTFILAEMDSVELADYNEQKEDCFIQKIEKPSLKTICECVNQDESDIQNSNCDDIWDITKLTNQERQAFVSEISQCIEHKNDPNFTLTVCECIRADKNDLELKKRCISKFDINSLSSEEITRLKSDMGDCSLQSGNDLELICSCLKEERTTGKMSESCLKNLAGLEKKYESKSKAEMEAFLKQLLDCLSSDY